MVKKKYRIKASGNIRDALRTGKIQFSCISRDFIPHNKTVKISQSKASTNLYCRPTFYSSLENLDENGAKIKLMLMYRDIDFKYNIDHPDWITITKIDNEDVVAPVQFWVEVSENKERARMGKIEIYFEHDGQKYYEDFTVTQYGKASTSTMDAEIKIDNQFITQAEYNGQYNEIKVEYIGIDKIREPFYSPWEVPWVKIQKIKEYKASNTVVEFYNIAIQKNDTAEPRTIDLVFSGTGLNEKELQTNVHIQQSGNPDYMVEEDSSEPEVE